MYSRSVEQPRQEFAEGTQALVSELLEHLSHPESEPALGEIHRGEIVLPQGWPTVFSLWVDIIRELGMRNRLKKNDERQAMYQGHALSKKGCSTGNDMFGSELRKPVRTAASNSSNKILTNTKYIHPNNLRYTWDRSQQVEYLHYGKTSCQIASLSLRVHSRPLRQGLASH